MVPGQGVEIPGKVPFTGQEGVDSDSVVCAGAMLEVHWSVPKLAYNGRGVVSAPTPYMDAHALQYTNIVEDLKLLRVCTRVCMHMWVCMCMYACVYVYYASVYICLCVCHVCLRIRTYSYCLYSMHMLYAFCADVHNVALPISP